MRYRRISKDYAIFGSPLPYEDLQSPVCLHSIPSWPRLIACVVERYQLRRSLRPTTIEHDRRRSSSTTEVRPGGRPQGVSQRGSFDFSPLTIERRGYVLEPLQNLLELPPSIVEAQCPKTHQVHCKRIRKGKHHMTAVAFLPSGGRGELSRDATSDRVDNEPGRTYQRLKCRRRVRTRNASSGASIDIVP